MRLLWWWLVSCAGWSTQACAGEAALLFGHDDRRPVAVSEAPWQSLARIETQGDNLCSGVLIEPYWVLSAGHCFLTQQGERDPVRSLTLAGSQQERGVDSVFLPVRLKAGLIPDGEGFDISPEAGAFDVALLHLKEAVTDVAPLPLWPGSATHLAGQLARQSVSQAGYPVDHPDTLLAHDNCRVERINERGMLEHRCDTLAGDSGSPLLLRTPAGWQVVGVQSSAPLAAQREQANNLAVALPTVQPLLRHWLSQPVSPSR